MSDQFGNVTDNNDNNQSQDYDHLAQDRFEDDNSVLNSTGGVGMTEAQMIHSDLFGMNQQPKKRKMNIASKVYVEKVAKDEIKRREEQSRKDKQQNKNKIKVLSQSNIQPPSKNKQYIGQQKDKGKWLTSVLTPFDSAACRGPSSYLQPTSLLEAKAIIDFTPGVSNALTIVSPLMHCGAVPMGSGGSSWGWDFITNFKNTSPINTISFNTYTSSQTSILAGYGTPSTATQGSRFTSYRITQLGVRVIPIGANLSKAGVITLACTPGKSYNLGSIVNQAQIPVSDATQLRQLPTSYEVSTATLGPEGTDYVWLPLDPMDYVFMGGVPAISSLNLAGNSADEDLLSNYTRSQIYIHYNGIASSDSFRIVVKYGVEFVPTPAFEPFTNYQLSTVDQVAVADLKNRVADAGFVKTINGSLGKTMLKYVEQYGFLAGPYRPFVDMVAQGLQNLI